MRKAHIYLLLIFATHAAQAVERVSMETVNVGQGSANFLTLEDPVHGKIVVVFDAGSSSNYVHQKFLPDKWSQNDYKPLMLPLASDKTPEEDETKQSQPSSSDESEASLSGKGHTPQPTDAEKKAEYQAKHPESKTLSISKLKELAIAPAVDIAKEQIAHMAKIISGAAI